MGSSTKRDNRGLDRFLAHQHLHGVRVGRGQRRPRRRRSVQPSAPPGCASRSRARLWAIRNSQGRSGGVSSRSCNATKARTSVSLHDVLAVDDRSHETRAIAGAARGRSSPARARSPPGGRGSARAVLRSSRRSLEHCDSRVALEPEGEALGIFRVVQHGNNFLAELPGRHRRAERARNSSGLMPMARA